jgi:multiple sugar transport system substrate-binding protein/sn-glycerol 3-phosphate transport system substrate-binding protein
MGILRLPSLVTIMKSSRFYSKLFFALLLAALVLTACGSVSDGSVNTESAGGLIKTIHPATLTAISAAAGDKSTLEPDPLGIPWSDLNGLEITFWYIWDLDEPGIGMNAIVDRFNLENEWGIRVTSHDHGLTHDPLESIETAKNEGLVPQVMNSDAPVISSWYRAGLTVDLTPYMSDPAAGLPIKEQNDYYSGIFEPFILPDDIRPGLPFTQSIQVLYYNQTWAAELGFSQAPGSSSDLIDQVCAAAEGFKESKDQAGGIILYPEAANITGWIYAYEGNFQNQNDGSYQFSSPELIHVARDWQDLSQGKCGYMISQYPDPMAREIEFAKFNQRQTLIFMNSAEYLDQVHLQANQTGRADDWTMLPFLGPDGYKAIPSKIQSGAIFNTTPEEQLAAWLFLKYLTSPEVQAEWVEYSFFYPTRKESLRFLRDFRTENPDWAKGLNVLKYARTQPIDPSWEVVQQAVGDAFEELLLENYPGPIELLAVLDLTAEELRIFTGDQQ